MTLARVGIAVAVVAVLGALVNTNAYSRAEAKRWKRVADSLGVEVARVDTVYLHQRDTVLRRIRSQDTLTLTVDQWKTDTIRVVEYVAKADTALRACEALVVSCDERDRLRVEQLAAVNNRLRAVAAQVPSRWAKLKQGGCVVGGAAGGGLVGQRVGEVALGAGIGALAGLLVC